jgi:hypothetical protein
MFDLELRVQMLKRGLEESLEILKRGAGVHFGQHDT